MANEPTRAHFRFGIFEVDMATGELRRKGILVRTGAQPLQVLNLLIEHAPEMVSREEICRTLWPDGTYVDFDHGVNSAINRIREALGDSASNPRFVETLARRGYRFLAPIERVEASSSPAEPAAPPQSTLAPESPTPKPEKKHILARPEELPHTSHRVVLTLFVLLQAMYVAFYVGALANLAEIWDLLSPLPQSTGVFALLLATAAILIPVRAFTLSIALFRAPAARAKLLRLWGFLFVADELWALAPFLLLHHINAGLALACVTLLVYSPFAQRSLILMGAAEA
ncbi:MAG: winged helix-turn-helix domain-containing protein [Terracidiphilus sp.]|nr:winged helix-turn-helix domain-containing protein [Terracidiphilus sp.]